MRLSVIIPCYNAASVIAVQLGALANQEWSEPWEVLVVDNRCTDHSMAIVKSYEKRLPHLRIVEASARQGQSYALNVGAAAARGESLAFCDADDEVGENWVRVMGETAMTHDFVACRLNYQKLNPPEHYAALGKGGVQLEGLQVSPFPPYFPFAGSGTIAIKRALHEAVGGFSEQFPYLLDAEYCYRLYRIGVKLYFTRDTVLHVRSRPTLFSIYRQARNYAEYEELLFKRCGQGASKDMWRWRAFAQVWWALGRKGLKFLASKEGRLGLSWRIGSQVGHLKGALKYRVPPLS